jgi:CRP-like cAMP-binding protein
LVINLNKLAYSYDIIEKGFVNVYRGSERTPDALINTRGIGDVFGENALRRAKHIPRSASVVAK